MHLTLCIYNTLGVSNNYSCMDKFFSYNEKKKKKNNNNNNKWKLQIYSILY